MLTVTDEYFVISKKKIEKKEQSPQICSILIKGEIQAHKWVYCYLLNLADAKQQPWGNAMWFVFIFNPKKPTLLLSLTTHKAEC